MTMNASDLRDAYRPRTLEEARLHFRQGSPCCPQKYFHFLENYLEPYRGFVKALFNKPDVFNRFPYTAMGPPSNTHPLIQNFQDCHSTYQEHMGKVHAAYGIAGEAIEFTLSNSPENDAEEIGDLMFYTIALLQEYKIPINTLFPSYHPEEFKSGPLVLWLKVADKSLDATKREVFYGQDGHKLLDSRIEMLKAIALMFGGSMDLTNCRDCVYALTRVHDAVTHNIEKLLKRYPTLTFTTEDSYNRLDKLDEVQSNSTGA